MAGTSLVISAEASASSTAFASSSNNLSARTKTAANVEWATDNSFPASGEVITTPDISAVIQEVVDLSAWCGGKNLNILIEGSSTDSASSREVRASDGGQSGSPRLLVTYEYSTATGCVQGEAIYHVASSRDNL